MGLVKRLCPTCKGTGEIYSEEGSVKDDADGILDDEKPRQHSSITMEQLFGDKED